MRSALVVSGGGFQGLGLLESLQCIPDVRPMIADIHEDNVTRYFCADYFVVPALSDAASFASAVRQLVITHAIEAIFPATARELPTLARLRDELHTLGARVAVAPFDLVTTLLDKEQTANFLLHHGIATQAPLDPTRHDFTVGLFGKPRLGWGGTGTVTARTADEIHRHLSNLDAGSMIWVPLIEDFEEFSVDFACSPSGYLSPLVLRRRIRTSGGFAVISESVTDPALARLAGEAARVLVEAGGRGIFNLQLIRPRAGVAFVSDVNPRFGTSAVHGLAVGVNLARFFMDDCPIAELPRPPGTRTVRRLATIALPRPESRPAAVVFDLDDTLVDHKLWMASKLRGTVGTVRDWVDEGEFMLFALQLVDEGERARLVDRIVEHFGWPRTHHEILLAAYREVHVPSTPLYSDVVPVLSSLRDAGFKVAILTDNPPATQRSKIEFAEALGPFSAVVYSRDTGQEKPSSTAFAAMASALTMEPRELCMVGDNYFRDAVGAIRSGYGQAFVLERRGSFARPHPEIANLAGVDKYRDRIHGIDSLVALREILLSS